MKRLYTPCLACILPLAIAGSLIGGSNKSSAEWKPLSKFRKSSITLVKAQTSEAGKASFKSDAAEEVVSPQASSAASKVNQRETEQPATLLVSQLTDEEIFDLDLSPTQRPANSCVPQMAPGCTDVMETSPLPSAQAPLSLGSDASTSASSTSSATASTSNPAVSNPQRTGGFGGVGTDMASASNTTQVLPFTGDFFGGDLVTTSVTSAPFALVAQQPGDNKFFTLASNGGFPDEYQTIGGPFMTAGGAVPTDNSPVNVLGPVDGYGEDLVLISASQDNVANVQFNPPGSADPNPQTVKIYNLAPTTRTGGLDPAISTGRTKLAEGASPIPRDRVFFNYSYFDGARLTSQGINVHRYTPGFEKTFFNGNASIEVRTPFASTLTSNIDTTAGVVNPTDVMFGNVTLYAKALLYQTRTYAYSAGLGFTLPTANNINVYSGPTQSLQVTNDSVHLMPFLGAVYAPNDRLFTQGFLQFDIDSNGNRVNAPISLSGTSDGGLQKIGTYRDASYVYASGSVGYWLYRSQSPGNYGLTGFSPTAELHYNRSLQNGNVINDKNGNAVYGQSFTNIEVLNAVVGANMIFGRNRILTTGFATPLGMGVDKQFNGELRIMYNWYFGGGNSSPFTRIGGAQF